MCCEAVGKCQAVAVVQGFYLYCVVVMVFVLVQSVINSVVLTCCSNIFLLVVRE